MGVVTIKAGKSRARAVLMHQARERASHLLEADTSRVLVVYGNEEASLYFESEAGPSKAQKRA